MNQPETTPRDRESAPAGARRLKVSPEAPETRALRDAADVLLNGGVVGLPTETVYGVAVDAANPAAVRRLYELKGREESKAIPLLISDLRMLRHISPLRDEIVLAFLNLRWPGPLTAVLPRYSGAFAHLATDASIGVRWPDHPTTVGVIRTLCRPLAVTSANLSGKPPARNADAVEAAFGERLDLILDAGPSPMGTPSTVLDLRDLPPVVLREGALASAELIEEIENLQCGG